MNAHQLRVGGVRIMGNGMRMLFDEPEPEPEAQPATVVSDKRKIACSKDFSSVRWGKITFTFTKKQRPVVAALWAARNEDVKVLSAEYLLEVSESEGQRLRDVFKNHPAWGTMIVRAEMGEMGLGGYMMAEPDEED